MTRPVYLAPGVGVRSGSTPGRRDGLPPGRGGMTSDSAHPADSRNQPPGERRPLPCRPGDRFVLAGPEGHHAATVKRASPGEEIDVVDGRGGRARCAVVGVSKGEVELEVLGFEREPAPSPRITLLQALAKGSRDEQAVETATEYGVWRIVPWASARAVANWKGKEEKARRRWESVVLAASKQSRRSWIPEVLDVCTTPQALRLASAEGADLLVCHEEADVPIARAGLQGSENLWIVVGPEGGLTPEEIESFERIGGRTVLLSPNVLRSSSAGPFAVAALSGMRGSAG